MKDWLRNVFSIRTKRRLPPVGRAPKVGAYLVSGDMKMHVTRPVSRDLWDWMVLSGWRNVPVANDRRQMRDLPEDTFSKLLESVPAERDALLARIMRSAKQSESA